ncbi:unnamed protein product [Amoebophrya sp. A25]|nr:unnamed protein product [Amoebophrya sp. A25]|eukprot:GSA25T00014451001.1
MLRIKGKKKFGVLEIGCGIRVPSVGSQAEGVVWDISYEESASESEVAGDRKRDFASVGTRVNPGDKTCSEILEVVARRIEILKAMLAVQVLVDAERQRSRPGFRSHAWWSTLI